MVENKDTVLFRGFVLQNGVKKGYNTYTEYPVKLDNMLRPVDVVFKKGEIQHYIEIESGGEAGTSYDPKGRIRDIRIVAKADKGFILVKNMLGKTKFEDTLSEMNKKGQYNNVNILTWEEYKKQAIHLHSMRAPT